MQAEKQQILETAMELMVKNGIRRTSIDDICRELRISKKTLYTVFSTKEAIVEALLEFRNTELNRYFAKALQGKNALESLMIIIKNVVKFSNTGEGILREDIMKYYPKIYDKFTLHFSVRFRAGFEENLRQGIAEGFYRKDLDVEILSAFQVMVARYSPKREMEIVLSDTFSQKRVAEFFFDVFVRYVVSEKGLKFYEENYLKKNEKYKISLNVNCLQ